MVYQQIDVLVVVNYAFITSTYNDDLYTSSKYYPLNFLSIPLSQIYYEGVAQLTVMNVISEFSILPQI